MPITEYKVIIGTNAKEIEDAVHADGLTPIGGVDSSFDGSYALQSAGVGTYDIGAVTGYELKQGRTIPELEAQVNACLAGGKQPINGVLSWHDAFIQEMGVVEPISGGGAAQQLPIGEAFDVLGFDANKDLKAMKSGMAQWLGEDRQIGGNAFDFIPVTYLTGGGQRVSQGVPSLRGLSSSPVASSVASRDAGGVLSGNTASKDVELPNLKQVREMIEAAGNPEGITGSQYEVASFNKETGAMEAVKMNMNIWTGTDLPRYDAAMDFVPITKFAAGGLSSTQSVNAIDEMPNRGTIPVRDINGRMYAESAYTGYQVTNFQQVEAMIAASRKAIEDGIIDIINGAINGASSK